MKVGEMFSKLLVPVDGSDNSFRGSRSCHFFIKEDNSSNYCSTCHGISSSCLCSVTADIGYNYLKIHRRIQKYLK